MQTILLGYATVGVVVAWLSVTKASMSSLWSAWLLAFPLIMKLNNVPRGRACAKGVPIASQSVSFDSLRIAVSYRGREQSIRWDEIRRLEIVTTDEGPWAPDCFWLLYDAGCVCRLLIVQENMPDGLLSAFQTRLSGFNNEVVIRAMGSTIKQQFLVWHQVE